MSVGDFVSVIPMSLNKIKQLLEQRIGLNPESVGDSSIKRAVNQRLAALEIASNREYVQLLSNSMQEVNELIEEVVVPETWFFRNQTPFVALGHYVKTQLLPRSNQDGLIRILSAPCSTGEEPYSIAISLLENGLAANRFEIDAIDISKRAVTKAKRAIYGKNSFRDVDERLVQKYFNKVRSGHHLVESVRNKVKFKMSNFLVGSLSPHPGYYDIIFCRNLLIYFNRDVQLVALEKLHRSLKDNGMLFVGHAETSQMAKSHFEKYDHPHSFAYVKKASAPVPVNQSVAHIDTPINISVPKEWQAVFNQISKITPFRDSAKLPVKTSITPVEKKPEIVKKKTSISPILIERLANEGKYEKAMMLCQEYIASYPESAQAYYLQGMIYHSLNNVKQAESCLRKAIYLDPNHEQAMALSMLLAQERGDKDAVESFKRRLQRIRNRNRGKT